MASTWRTFNGSRRGRTFRERRRGRRLREDEPISMFPGELERLDDETLVSRAFRGEYLAFEVLYFRHRDWVVHTAWLITGDRGDAPEVLQETFLHLIAFFPEPGSFTSFRALLYPTIEAQCTLLSRRRRKIVHLEDARLKRARTRTETAKGELDSDPLELFQNTGDRLHEPARTLESLPEDTRKGARLHFALGMRLEEISEALNLPQETVRSRLHEALEDLENTQQDDLNGREHPSIMALEAFRCEDKKMAAGESSFSTRRRNIRRHVEDCEKCKARLAFLNSLKDQALRPSSPIIVPVGVERAIIGEGRTRAEAVRRGLEPPTRRDEGSYTADVPDCAVFDVQQKSDRVSEKAGDLYYPDKRLQTTAGLARWSTPARLRWVLWALLIGLAMILMVRATCLWQDEPEASGGMIHIPTILEARNDPTAPVSYQKDKDL